MDRNLHSVDAEQQIAGRLATAIATLLIGKHKVGYAPHLDCGDHVRVMNVDKMKFTGKKLANKVYYRASGYPGGLKMTKLSELVAKHPDRLLRSMVYKMLPKNKLRERMIKRLSFEAKQK